MVRAGPATLIYCSSGTNDTRVYDGARDPRLNVVTKTDAGPWTPAPNNPYFILGNAAQPNGLGGPGQMYGDSIFYLETMGGDAASSGQKFTISDREIPVGARIVVTQAVFRASKTGDCTNNLILRVLDDQLAELGRVTMPNAKADGVDRAYEIAPPFSLHQGRTYFIAPEFDGPRPSSPSVGFTLPAYYPFTGGDASLGHASWGGTVDCVPVLSGPAGDWSAYTLSEAPQFDMSFRLQGTVLGKASGGTMMLVR